MASVKLFTEDFFISLRKIRKLIRRYLKYLLRSRSRYSVHSPFVFQFINEVLKKKPTLEYLEDYSQRLKENNQVIEIEDFGAGSRKQQSNRRKVSEIYRISSSKPKKADLIRRICEYEFSSFEILELGTNLGMTAYALAQSEKCKEVTSIEGCSNLYSFAKGQLGSVEKIKLIHAQFDQVLDEQLEKRQAQIVYIDGNHTYEATLRYFQIIAAHPEVELILFDDINWSHGMRCAWDEIYKDPRFHVSAELFKLGILWRRKEQRKEHFVIRY